MSNKEKGGMLPFILGIIAVLIFGWWIFPHILFTAEEQPVQFNHKLHLNLQDQELNCKHCHFYREDGSFSGSPQKQICADSGCHAKMQTDTQAEKKLVKQYLDKNKSIPWKSYQKQPDNVYFSHIAHKQFDCATCHLDLGQSKKLPTYFENIFTAYSKQTMKMHECERCHAQEGASNACFICHK